jgi:hypothetical protein
MMTFVICIAATITHVSVAQWWIRRGERADLRNKTRCFSCIVTGRYVVVCILLEVSVCGLKVIRIVR